MPNTPHYKIFNYWRHKAILRSGRVVSVYGDEMQLNATPVVEDWGFPCCWACGRDAINDEKVDYFYEANKDLLEADYYKKLYELKPVKSSLNRCHIQPKALGGVDEPENLFLMCAECHHLSPDTMNREAFFRWVYDRRERFWSGKLKPEEVIRLFDEELSRRGLPSSGECIEAAGSAYAPSEAKEFLMKNVNSHMSRCQDNSMIIGLVDWFLNDIQQHVSIDELYRIASEKIRLNTSEHNGYFVIK